ncbi:MAG: (Fe-S)-binding protein [Actinomycetota bacterium]|nr:(Fe-S)-binding protein [Actinomycetota bacterium]
MDLGIDETALSTCVQCGLCLPHCPTFRVSGDESRSPRGRVALMRAVQRQGAPLTAEVKAAFDTCVQCRGCESACPSQVPFGRLIEETRASVADRSPLKKAATRLALEPLSHPGALRAGTGALRVAQRFGLVPKRLAVPRLAPRPEPLVPSGDDVVLFTGCVMDAWQRDVHQAGQVVLEAAGFGVRPSGDDVGCCGALHGHAGLRDQAKARATSVIERLGGDTPILVDSAGCGAAMKEYGVLLGTPAAKAFSARVFDVAEWLEPYLERLPRTEPLDVVVAVQDPCHLRHVQRAHLATRALLAPFVARLVELDDDGLCCGAGGAYSLFQPKLAGAIRDRKCEAIARAGADVVASANPGCLWHLGAKDVAARHPLSIVAEALERGGVRP